MAHSCVSALLSERALKLDQIVYVKVQSRGKVMDAIILWIVSTLFGGLSAWRLTALSCMKSELQRSTSKGASEAQQALREMLSRRQGFDLPKTEDVKANVDFREIVATPIFAVTCLTLGGIFWAHPDALPIRQLIENSAVKPILLLVGQVWFFSMFVCSVILTINQRRN